MANYKSQIQQIQRRNRQQIPWNGKYRHYYILE